MKREARMTIQGRIDIIIALVRSLFALLLCYSAFTYAVMYAISSHQDMTG